jgi:hypothetical protein
MADTAFDDAVDQVQISVPVPAATMKLKLADKVVSH